MRVPWFFLHDKSLQNFLGRGTRRRETVEGLVKQSCRPKCLASLPRSIGTIKLQIKAAFYVQFGQVGNSS